MPIPTKYEDLPYFFCYRNLIESKDEPPKNFALDKVKIVWYEINPDKRDFCDKTYRVVGFCDEKPIASAYLINESAFGRFWLSAFAVSQKYQRKGIGTKILLEIKEYIKNNSIKKCELTSSEKAVKLYKKVGFKKNKEFSQKDDYTRMIMEL